MDGDEQDTVAFPLGGSNNEVAATGCPSGVARGEVLLSLGGASIEAQAVARAGVRGRATRDRPGKRPAKLGDDVVLATWYRRR